MNYIRINYNNIYIVRDNFKKNKYKKVKEIIQELNIYVIYVT